MLRPGVRQWIRQAVLVSRQSRRVPFCRQLTSSTSPDLAQEHDLSVDGLSHLESTRAFRTSPKLSALHARLKLPTSFPPETLHRTLIDPSADPNPAFNNASFSLLGRNLLGYYCSEHMICKYPRLPMPTVFAAMWAYVGPAALASLSKGWGVEVAAFPGSEVDPGLLQVKRLLPGDSQEATMTETEEEPVATNAEHLKWRQKGMSTRVVYDDEFGETPPETLYYRDRDLLRLTGLDVLAKKGVTQEDALANQVRSFFGAVYLHQGQDAAKRLFKEHILSRKVDFQSLFKFKYPTRDLSLLCAREGFEAPVARLLSETGRKSRHPVFVVGVFSGQDKLGEAAGASLDEARIRAAVAALKSWYLYSPIDGSSGVVPSDTEGRAPKPFRPAYIDGGELP